MRIGKLWRVPYRWQWGTIYDNFRWTYWTFYFGFRNLYRWFNMVWRDDNCSYESLLEFMEVKMRSMAAFHEAHGVTVDRLRTARQLRSAAVLCQRLREENYHDSAAAAYGDGTKAWAQEWSNVERQDRELLGKIISRHVTKWWD